MIDLSFLTDAEKEAILKVLNRDSELKKAEEKRIRHLQDEVNDENELKYKSGQWFYEAKSRRHREKIHGADLVRASIRKRKNPATIELYGVMEPPDEAEEDLMPSNIQSIQSARKVNLHSPDIGKNIMNGTASPAKQRKNPFNSEGAVNETDLHNEMSKPTFETGLVNGQVGKKSDIMSSIIKYGVKLPYPSPIGDRKTTQETEENPSPKLPPVPKPRKLLINGKPPERSNSSLQREDSLNKRKGILKRRSSSSSTDSESIRILPNVEALKLVLPTSPILEAEQTNLFDDQMTSSENSPDRQKQVRFSEYILQKPPTPNPESYNAREIGEFGILDPSSYQQDLDDEFQDHHPYEEPRPTYSDVDYTNTMEGLDLEENPTVSSTLHAPSNSSPILEAEKKPEDQSQELNYNKLYEMPDEIYPEINIDSAGTEPLYAVVKKSSKSSPDQEKDFEMEPRFIGQRGKIENAYQIEKRLEFGKSYGGDGKINFGDRYTSIQPGKAYGSTNEDFLAPERSRQVQSSYDEPKPSDYIPKWRRPLSLDDEDSLAQPTVHESPDFGDAYTIVKPNSENRTDFKYSPVESNKDSQYRSIFLRNTPEIEKKSSNFPVSQNLHSSPRPVSEGFQTHEIFLHDKERDLPKSANFKVMSLKERIHDTSREQMSNPSQFQNLKHFWNVEDKNQSKGDVDTSSNRILTDVLKRNKPTRANLRQRNSEAIPTDDLSLPNSFDSSLSEEEQTSHKVASWLAHTPTVYGAEQVDASDDLVHPREEDMEDVNKTLVDRNYHTDDFSSALQKLTDEALEAPKISKTEHLRSEEILNSPKKPYLLDERKKITTILVNSAEKTHPTSGFYDRVVQVSRKQSPEKEIKIAADIPAVTLKQYPKEEIEESVERSVAPRKTENELKIVFEKLRYEYESNKSDDEPQVEESNLKNEEQQLVETKAVIERSSIPKGNDHQEFISALNRLEIEASTPPVIEEYEQPEKVLTLNTASPVKSSFKIGFEHMMLTEDDTVETSQKNNVAYTVQSYPPYFEDQNPFEELVEKTIAPSRKDEDDFRASLKKLEQEADLTASSGELEDPYENTQPLQSTGNITTVHCFTIPSFAVQKMPSPSHSVENKSNLDDLYANRTKKSTENVVNANVIKATENPKYTFQEKLPVEEEPLQKTTVTTEESSADYRNRIMRLEEEAAASVPEESEDLSEGETFHVSPAPMKDVFISKKVFSNNESMPTELPQPQPYAYDKMANSPQSPSDQTGSFTGSAENVLYKKPDTPSEKSNTKKGLLERSKTSPQQITYGDKLEDDAFEPEVNENDDLQKMKLIPKTGIFESKDQKSIDPDQPSLQKIITYTDKIEDDDSEPGVDEENEASKKLKSIPKMIGIPDSGEDMKTINPDRPSLQKIILYTDKMEDDASEPEANSNEDSQKIQSIPQMAGSSESKEDLSTIDSDQSGNQNMLKSSPIENEIITPKNLPLTEFLEFGTSKSGCGKIQSSLMNDDDFSQNYPELPEGEVLEKDRDLDTNMTTFVTLDDEASPTQQSTLPEVLEFGKGGSGCGKIQSSLMNDDFSQNYPELPEGEVLEKDRDLDTNMTTFVTLDDEASPTQQSPLTEVLEFGKSGSGYGKIQSSSINDDPSQKYPQLVMDGEFDKDKESLENNKEHKVLKEKIASLDMEDKEPLVDERKDQNEALISALEKSEHPSSKESDKDKSVMQQRRVGDIKLLWEGVGASQEAAKQPVLSNTKHTFSPVDLSVTPKSSSLDSEGQNITSLVTFKKVTVEDEEDPMYPVDQLKSFWENEKNKNTKDKADREPMMTNESWSDDKGATSEDPRSKFKKWHTIHNFFNEAKSSDLIKKIPGRSISLGESANESLKDHIKPASFQNLKNFWTTSSKLVKKTNQALPENKNQFGSNPDISKESFVSRAKGRLAAKSLQDIRENPSSVSQYQVYDAEPHTRKFIKGNGQNEYIQNAVKGIKTEKNSSSVIGGNDKLGKPISSVNVMAQESSLPSSHSKTDIIPDNCESKQDPGIQEAKQKVLTDIEKSVAPKKSEISLKLKSLQCEVPSTNINMPDEGPQSTIFERYPEDQTVYRDEENGEINEKGRKMLLVKQNGLDSSATAFSNVSGSLQQNEENLSGNNQISDSSEVVNENIEKTGVPLNSDLCVFDKKLQNLYNESLDDSQTGYLTEPIYMDINEPDENFSKVLAISSDTNIQSSGGEKSHQPIIVNISSKKTEIGNEALSKSDPDNQTSFCETKSTPPAEIPMVLGLLEKKVDISHEATNITSEEPTSGLMGSSARDPEVDEFSSEPNYSKVMASQPEKMSKKEITERIEMPVILPITHSNYFDEKLKQLYEESQNSESNLKETTDCDVAKNKNIGEPNKANIYLYSTEPKKTFLESSNINMKSSQPVLCYRETLTDESAPSRSQVPDILVHEVNETIEKTVAPTRISAVKGLEKLLKEALNEEEGALVENVTSAHEAVNESASKLSDLALGKYSVSESFPRERDTVQEGTEAARYEEHQEVPSETSITFMSDSQSTPVKDINSSLRRSTLELYLETPYRREISKSIDFDFSGYVPSEVNKCMDESHPILNALKRSAAKTVNSKAVQEVSPTSTNEDKLENSKEDTLAPLENSFPENADKFKRMSQSVPTFLQDDTDGRETDSASESSFQIGRHKKSPSSLTNLSGSSGMASMSSVSGSVMSVYSGDFGNVDIKGNIEYSIEYAEQLKEFLIYIYQCKDLAAADVKKQRSDPYVKAYLLPEKAKMGKRKTAVKKKTLNPVYNEILRYKIPKESLQAQTLNLSVWHRDVLGRNSFLGEVNQNLANWEWENKQKNWYPLEPRTLASSIGLENRGEMKLSLQYIPVSPSEVGKKPNTTGEVHIWIRECIQLPMLRENKINSFVKCTILPDTSRKSRQKTRTVDKTPNPIFNHTMVYDGFKEDDLREACVELTVWDHNKLTNHFLGGLRIGQGTGKSYGTPVDWMDSSPEESTMWQKMIASPNTWIDGMLPLRMFKMAKLSK
ncbi:synaptotagmin-like protein 2 isoform X2 [Dendrobates tinctorius]|uniref:synaptotagmin-like protein 2 isoform X2 n=1 Tax=Dendrobates tinctorius TaxID=92724 RepID=UPI003CCA3608